jgi:phosphatidylinositol alpha-1,6-mannosyltransferase
MTRERGLEADVVFAGAARPEDLPALYAACDVFVMASRRIGDNVEGFGIVCLEAAAAGKPVVAGRSGGVPDAIEDGVTGLLVDPESPTDIAEKISLLLRDPARRARMGEAGRQRVVREFDRRAFRDRVRSLIEAALGGGVRSSPAVSRGSR